MQELVDGSLDHPQAMLVDTLTRREFGPANGHTFSEEDIGTRVEINNKELQIADLYRCGSGLSAGGAVIMNQRDFLRCQPLLPPNEVSLGLVRVERSAEVNRIARELRDHLPEDIEVLTRREVIDGEIRHWVWQTNYGLIFQSGVLVAVVVGTAIVYQVLASEVTSRMPEYATLKAMGYGNSYLVRVMVEQSLLLAIVAFLAGWGISAILYEITAVGAQIPIRMTLPNLVLVLSLTAGLCVASGIAAFRKAYRADPAELF
jgi:putative ABC transport system permease protein